MREQKESCFENCSGLRAGAIFVVYNWDCDVRLVLLRLYVWYYWYCLFGCTADTAGLDVLLVLQDWIYYWYCKSGCTTGPVCLDVLLVPGQVRCPCWVEYKCCPHSGRWGRCSRTAGRTSPARWWAASAPSPGPAYASGPPLEVTYTLYRLVSVYLIQVKK